MLEETILKEERNCWRIRKAKRLSFLIDADAYFRALISAVDQAEKAVYISGWDIDSRVRLIRSSEEKESSEVSLGPYLNEKAKETPALNIYILCWDFSVIYTLEREWLQSLKFEWQTHRRVHFHLDSEHPAGASHHQKFVVVDDALAFCGGIDLTKNRWDTPQHHPRDSRRINPDGKPYATFHDIQTVADGDLAGDLGDLFRLRWLRATGRKLAPVDRDKHLNWPQESSPDMTHVRAAVARTHPAYKDREAVREVEYLFQDMIASSRHYLYLENQYFTSPVIADALIKSLEKKEGPDILLLLPRRSRGLLEQSTMDALRARQIERILKADAYKRLLVAYPALSKTDDVFVHAKIMIADDRLARVGSANLTNRSMGLDTECDVVIEALDEPENRGAVALFRNRLLAEHTGHSVEAVSRAIESKESFLSAVRSLSNLERSLKKISIEEELPVDSTKLIPDTALLDPHRPVELDRILDRFVEESNPESKRMTLWKILAVLGLLLALAGVWQWSPLSQWIDPQYMAQLAQHIEESPLSPVYVLGAYLAGGILMVPVTVLVIATAMVFPAFTATGYALGGCLLSAILTYGIGARLGSAPLERVAGRRINRLNKRLARKGILAIAVIRNLPLAPFTLVNMAAGASKVRFRDYVVGTGIGMLPGIVAVTFFADRVFQTLKKPNWLNITISCALFVAFGLGFWWLKRRLQKTKEGE